MTPEQVGAAPVQPPRRMVVTPALVIANVVVFGVMLALGVSPTSPDQASLLKFGANFGIAVVFDNEWWRAFTYMFVHIGFVHLLVNMYSLWNVGGFVERLLGKPLYVAVYVMTGLAGAFASILWKPATVSAGASGAIFGLFGVVIGFTIRARDQLPPQTVQSLRSSIVATLLFNLLFAVTNPYLDHAAHLGGLSVGLLAGIVATASAIERTEKKASWGSQGIVAAAVLALAVLAATRTKNQPRIQTEILISKAEVAIVAEQWAEAEKHASAALALREDPRARLWRGLAYEALKRRPEALADLDVAIPALERNEETQLRELAQALSARGAMRLQEGAYQTAIVDLRRLDRLIPNLPSVKNNLAWGLIRVGGAEDEALELAEAAVKGEANAASLGTRCFAHVAKGELEAAKADCEAAVAQNENDLVDKGMLRFIANDRAGAIELWQQAAKEDPTNGRDLEPWVSLARNGLDTPP